MGKNNKKNKLGKALLIGSLTIFGVSGISIFGKISVFDSLIKELKLVLSDEAKKDAEDDINQTQIPTEPPTESQTEPPTEEDNSSTQPIIININKTDPISVDKLKDQLKALEFQNDKIETGKSMEDEMEADTNNNTNDNNNSDESSNINKDNDTTENDNNPEMEKSTYEIRVDSPGQIIMTKSNSNNETENIDISYKQNQETVSVQFLTAIDSSDIVNENSISDLQQLNYFSVTPGIYIFETTYNFDDVNLYFINDINVLSSLSGQEESYEEIVVPTNEDIKVEISKDKPLEIFNIRFDHGFQPKINFYSDDEMEKNLVLKILDGDKSELQRIELNYTNPDDSNEVVSDFTFDDGKEYYIQVSSDDNIELTQTCYFKISQFVEDDSTEINFE